MTIGLDISTSVVGISIFNKEYKLINLSYIKLTKGKTLFEKLDEFIEFMNKEGYIKFPISFISIEEPLKKFKGKFSNADTIQKLTIMNALISGYLYKTLNIEPEYHNSEAARKTVFPKLIIPKSTPNKKYLIWNSVMNLEPQINWEYSKKTHKLKDENFDMADSYVIGMTSIINRIKTN